MYQKARCSVWFICFLRIGQPCHCYASLIYLLNGAINGGYAIRIRTQRNLVTQKCLKTNSLANAYGK